MKLSTPLLFLGLISTLSFVASDMVASNEGLPRFGCPKKGGELSSNLYVANCGPVVGLSHDEIESVFYKFGHLKGVYAADESGICVIVSYFEEGSAQAAFKALDGRLCPELGGRTLHIRYLVLQPTRRIK